MRMLRWAMRPLVWTAIMIRAIYRPLKSGFVSHAEEWERRDYSRIIPARR